MNLEDGLKYIYEKKFPIEYMINPFTLYSMLSDYCNKSFKDIEDVKLYIKVIERINLVEFVINKPLSTLEEMMLKNYENIIKFSTQPISYITRAVKPSCPQEHETSLLSLFSYLLDFSCLHQCLEACP